MGRRKEGRRRVLGKGGGHLDGFFFLSFEIPPRDSLFHIFNDDLPATTVDKGAFTSRVSLCENFNWSLE